MNLNKLKSKWLKLCVLLAVIAPYTIKAQAANKADDIFKNTTNAAEEVSTSFIGFCLVLCIVSWVVIGVLTMLDKFPKARAVGAAAGSAIICGAPVIGKYAWSKFTASV